MSEALKVYVSPNGLYEARVPVDDHLKTGQLDRMLGVSEAGLNDHLFEHLTLPGLMDSRGYQFDSELAVFLGIALDDIAEKTVETIEAMQQGVFEETSVYSRMLENLQDYETAEDIASKLIEFRYQQRAAVELGTLARLGTVSPAVITEGALEAIELSVMPAVSDDSFFESFGVTETIS